MADKTTPNPCEVLSPNRGSLPTIGFEFDLSYGASSSKPPPCGADSSIELRKVSTHDRDKHGFRLEGDGNRIEIATKPFQLITAGENNMVEVMSKIIVLVE